MAFLQSPAEMLKLTNLGATAPGASGAGATPPTGPSAGGSSYQSWQSILPNDVATPQHPDQFVPNSHPFMQNLMQQWQQQGTPYGSAGVSVSPSGGGVAPTVGG